MNLLFAYIFIYTLAFIFWAGIIALGIIFMVAVFEYVQHSFEKECLRYSKKTIDDSMENML